MILDKEIQNSKLIDIKTRIKIFSYYGILPFSNLERKYKKSLKKTIINLLTSLDDYKIIYLDNKNEKFISIYHTIYKYCLINLKKNTLTIYNPENNNDFFVFFISGKILEKIYNKVLDKFLFDSGYRPN